LATNEDEVSITELGDMPRGWLCDSKENEDQRREAEGYPDLLGETYVWKADLANGLNVSSGDVIAIWDGKSRGTEFTIRYAKARLKPVIIYNINDKEDKQ
jgi:hypothetical protein